MSQSNKPKMRSWTSTFKSSRTNKTRHTKDKHELTLKTRYKRPRSCCAVRSLRGAEQQPQEAPWS